VRIEKRAHPTVVGLFRYAERGNVVLPYDTRLLHEIIIPPGEELTPALRAKLGEQPSAGRRRVRLPELDGAVVNVELTRFPLGGVAPAGRVVEILGRPGEFGAAGHTCPLRPVTPDGEPQQSPPPGPASLTCHCRTSG